MAAELTVAELGELECLLQDAPCGRWQERIVTAESTKFRRVESFVQIERDSVAMFRTPSVSGSAATVDEGIAYAMDDVRLAVALRNHAPALLSAARALVTLRAENARLRAALKPFADIADRMGPEWRDGDHAPKDDLLTIGDLRRAAEALASSGGGGGPMSEPHRLPNGLIQGSPEDRATWWTCELCRHRGPLVGAGAAGLHLCMGSCGGKTPNPACAFTGYTGGRQPE